MDLQYILFPNEIIFGSNEKDIQSLATLHVKSFQLKNTNPVKSEVRNGEIQTLIWRTNGM